MPTSNTLINTEIYTKEYPDTQRVTAKQAKEIFFLTTDDLQGLDYVRPSGWGAYAMKTGSCKYFALNDVRETAIRKFGGSVQALVEKAEALNKRRKAKAEKDEQKRQEEARRRAEAERQRLAAIEEKKRVRLEKKRQAEAQEQDANSWRSLAAAMDGTGLELNGSTLPGILKDMREWKKQQTLLHQENTIDLTTGPISPPKEMIDGNSASTAKVSPS